MDIYSISFTHPRRPRHLHSPSSSFDAHDLRLPPHIQHLPENFPSVLPLPVTQPSPSNQADSETVEKLAILARSLHNVQVSYLLSDGGRSWNFYISGAYQQVMLARGILLKDSPIQVSPLSLLLLNPFRSPPLQHRTTIKVPRSDILDSSSSKPTLKPDIRRRLDEIASLTYAHIAVVNSPLSLSSRTPPDGISSSAGWTGLETERVCELVVTGQGDATELARVRLLVMLDELVRFFFFFMSFAHSIYRAVYMQNLAKLTKNFMLSLLAVNATCFNPFKRRLPPTYTFLPLSRVSSVPISSLRQSPPMVVFSLAKLKAVSISRLTIQTSYGSLVSFLVFRELEICSSSFLQTKFVSLLQACDPANFILHRVRTLSRATLSSFLASSIGWFLIGLKTSSLSCPTTRLLSSSHPSAVRRA